MIKVLLCIVFTLICSLSVAKNISLRVVDYPPQYFLDENNIWRGIDVELAVAIIREARLNPEFVELPWSRALIEIEKGSLHLMANLSKTEERLEKFRWIGPQRYNNNVIVLNKEYIDVSIESLNDLINFANERNLKIGIQQDAFYSDELNKLIAHPLYMKYFDSVTRSELNYFKLLNNRILCFIEDDITAIYKIKNNKEYENFRIHSFKVSASAVYLGVSKSLDEDIYIRLNDAFLRLERRGVLEKIRDSYYKF